MVALLDALDVKKATVVGHDIGAALAWDMAFSHPDRVERLVVMSVGFPGALMGGWVSGWVSGWAMHWPVTQLALTAAVPLRQSPH